MRWMYSILVNLAFDGSHGQQLQSFYPTCLSNLIHYNYGDFNTPYTILQKSLVQAMFLYTALYSNNGLIEWCWSSHNFCVHGQFFKEYKNIAGVLTVSF